MGNVACLHGGPPLNLAHLVQANRAWIGHFFKTKLQVPNPSIAPRLDVARLQQARLLCHNEARELNRAFFQKLAGSNANAAFRATFLYVVCKPEPHL